MTPRSANIDLAALRRSLTEVAAQARDAVEELGGEGRVDGLGVTVQIDGQLVFSGCNDFTTAVDDLQYDLGEGPCLHAQHHGRLVASRTIGTGERRWPLFTPRAAQLDLRSVVSAPLKVSDQATGSLNVYGTTPDRFVHLRPAEVAVVAGTIERALTTILCHATQTPTRRRPTARPAVHDATVASWTDGLNEAELHALVASLPLIEQAKGVLMGYYGIDDDAAFAVLARWSSARQTKLRDVCATLLDRVVATPRPDLTNGLQALLAPAPLQPDPHTPPDGRVPTRRPSLEEAAPPEGTDPTGTGRMTAPRPTGVDDAVRP